MLDFVNAQTVGFVAEYQGHLKTILCRLQQVGDELAWGLQGGGQFAAAAGEGAGDDGVGQSLWEVGDNAAVVEYIGGT